MNGPTDRLATRLAWWRLAWPFRWAHKPLCTRFEAGVVRLGRLHLCRGCLAAALGVVLGAALAAVAAPATLLVALSATIPALAFLSAPGRHVRLPQPARDALRLAAGTCPPFIVAALLGGHLLEGALAAVALAVLVLVHRRRRAPLRADLCTGCPELEQDAVCSGFARQARAVQVHERYVERALHREGFVPRVGA